MICVRTRADKCGLGVERVKMVGGGGMKEDGRRDEVNGR